MHGTAPDPAVDRWKIHDLKNRYTRSIDLRDWDELSSTLAPEMSAHFRADLVTEGADALVAELSSRLGADRVTVHQLANPSIEVDGDRATGTWTMVDRTICTDIGVLVDGASISTDEYRRDPERGWLITRITYQRFYESRVRLTDLPSFDLVASVHDIPKSGAVA